MKWLGHAAVFWLVILSFGPSQELKIGGFREFEAHHGDNYDLTGPVDALAYGVDGTLNLDDKHSTKARTEYISSGIARNFGSLEVGAGVETLIVH